MRRRSLLATLPLGAASVLPLPRSRQAIGARDLFRLSFRVSRPSPAGPGLGPKGILRLEAGVPEAARRALIDIGWPIGASDGGFGRYECIEHRMNGATRVYAAANEMPADGMALAY